MLFEMVKRSASSWLLFICSLFIASLILYFIFTILPIVFFLVLLAGLTPIVFLVLKTLLKAGNAYGRPAKLKSRH